jgi:hypothetical protein
MKRYLTHMLVAVGAASPLLAGCSNYRNWVDPCWPERYNNTARREVVQSFAPQVQNGHILDQTVWNYMFEAGTDELNGYGKEKLDFYVRQRPAPDPNVFLQTAHDVPYSPTEPERLGEARRELDLKRVQSIQRYLSAQMVGRPMTFDVAIHDPYPVGETATFAAGSFRLANAASASGPAGSLQTTNNGPVGAAGQVPGQGAGTSQGPTGGNGGADSGSGAGSMPR